VGFPHRHPNLELHQCPHPPCQDTCATCKVPPELKEGDLAFVTQTRSVDGGYQTILSKPVQLGDSGPYGMWHHVAGTWDKDSGTLAMYVDGRLDKVLKPAEHGYTGPMDCHKNTPECMEGLQIGGFHLHTGYSSQYFKGTIDEVRVWAVARSADEIRETMSESITSKRPGLKYCFRFDEGRGPLTKSAVGWGFGNLGGGVESAAPRWVKSDAPLTEAQQSQHDSKAEEVDDVLSGMEGLKDELESAIKENNDDIGLSKQMTELKNAIDTHWRSLVGQMEVLRGHSDAMQGLMTKATHMLKQRDGGSGQAQDDGALKTRLKTLQQALGSKIESMHWELVIYVTAATVCGVIVGAGVALVLLKRTGFRNADSMSKPEALWEGEALMGQRDVEGIL